MTLTNSSELRRIITQAKLKLSAGLDQMPSVSTKTSCTKCA